MENNTQTNTQTSSTQPVSSQQPITPPVVPAPTVSISQQPIQPQPQQPKPVQQIPVQQQSYQQRVQQQTLQRQQPLQRQPGNRPPPSPKKVIYGCFGCFGLAVLIFIVFVLIFVSQTSATGENPLARSLGLNTATFINTIILLVNLVFGAVALMLFLFAIVGFFRIFMARRDDKDSRRKGVTMAAVSGLLLMFLAFIWIVTYLFLSSKRVAEQKTVRSPIVTIPESTLNLTAPIEVKFDASGLPINTRNYDVLTYFWNFGDGSTATVIAPTHAYKDKGNNNGRFDVSLQVTKRDRRSNAESVDNYTTVVTIAKVELSADFTMDPSSGSAPLTVQFDAGNSEAPGAQITNYDWDFDANNDFKDGEGKNISHEFTQVGTYKVTLRVTDDSGQYKIVTKEIDVTGPNTATPVIDIPTKDGKYYAGVQYTFLGEKSTSPNGSIQKYEWDFGDGSPKANTRTANHTYKKGGTFEVILKVTDETGVTGELSQKIKVEIAESAPIAVITTVPAPAKSEDDFIVGTVPFEVAFDATKSEDPDNNIVDYKWDFDGDETIDDTGEKVTYAYKESGTYNATLTVVDAENNESKTSRVVKVQAQPLQARVTATPFDGVVPLTVTFDATSSSYPNGKIVSYEWDFGDGSAKRIDVGKVTYKYTKIGTFNATVTAISSDNMRSTAQTPISVRPVALTACFETSLETGPAPLAIEFDPRCSTGGPIAKYSWDFGDQETSKTRKPVHTFLTPGSYTVTLEVADSQNVINTFSKNILVTGQI